MSDLISRQDAIEAICDEIMSRFDVGITEGYELVEDALSGLPAVEPETKKGKWLMNGERYGHMYWRCSQCGEEVDYIGANFCPNCGSYNGGEEDE